MMPGPTARRRGAWRSSVAIAIVMLLLAIAAPIHAARDRDGDGLSDRQERRETRTNPRLSDTDGDGLDDGFEVRWDVTDPNERDTDGDGLIDSLEDIDGDHLSARGELRFKTDPTAWDTDGDGTMDGADDANENGIRDALEQDARKLPPRVRRVVQAARGDYVNNQNGCHTGQTSSGIYECIYGNTVGRLDVTLFGDSHALQWLPALDRAGENRGWKVTSFTKSACPSVALPVEKKSRVVASSCKQWRNNARAWLRSHPQDVVIVSNSYRYTLVNGKGERLGLEAREKRWRRAIRDTIKSLPKRTRVVVLADTPRFVRDPQVCLQKRGVRISDCQTRRAAAILERQNDVVEGVAERSGATFADLNAVVCPYDPCPLIAGETMMWRDNGHLTETYSKQLAPAMAQVVRSTLKPKRTSPLEALSSSGLAEATESIVVHEDFFEPDTIEVQAGVELEVLFTNVGRSPHQIRLMVDDGTGELVPTGMASFVRRGRTGEVLLSDPEPGEYLIVSEAMPSETIGRITVAPMPGTGPALAAAPFEATVDALAGVLEPRGDTADGQLHEAP